ncbi:MAG: GTP 3',8-cyclase MoaA [Candidatus Limnocylindrus sp.]
MPRTAHALPLFSGAPVDALQRPLRDVRLSVTDRCNFRCSYCMPAEVFGPDFAFLPRAELLTFEEIALVARELVALGARTLRITGGEPLVRRDLERLVALLRALDSSEALGGDPLDIALTTNGSLLAKLAAPLRAAGLNRITVSLDSLNPETFARMSGSALPLERVLQGIAAASAAGFSGIKLNAVIRRGVNDGEIPALVEYARAEGHTLRLIEYMDVGTTNGWRLDEVLPASEIAARINALHPIEAAPPTRPGEVANRFRYLDGGGEIGLIASVSAPFCGDCTRARVSADGHLYTCLFASEGTDLKRYLRPAPDAAALRDALHARWASRDDRYSELRDAETANRLPKVEMFRVGG